ncbi:hypothetical protein [Dysgonomonas reticulitermitis]
MKRILIISAISFIFTFSYSLFAQTNEKLWGGLEIELGASLVDKGDLYNVSYSDNKMSANTIKAVIGYYVTSQLSIGVSIGLNSYTLPGINMAPIWLDMRFHPLTKNPKLVLNGAIGYPLAMNENDLKGKFIAEASAGYKLFNIGKISFVPALGYNYLLYSLNSADGRYSQSRHSIFIKISILY